MDYYDYFHIDYSLVDKSDDSEIEISLEDVSDDPEITVGCDYVDEDAELWQIITNLYLAVCYNMSFLNTHGLMDMYYKQRLETVEVKDVWLTDDGEPRQGSSGRLPRSYLFSNLPEEDNEWPVPTFIEAYSRKFEDAKIRTFNIWSLLRKAAIIERRGRDSDRIWAALTQNVFPVGHTKGVYGDLEQLFIDHVS